MRPNGGLYNRAYTIHFQVWRPSPTVESDGCYSMVGENRFTSITLDGSQVSETPEPNNIISVRPGDVVGYFHATRDELTPGGIQLTEGVNNVGSWYDSGIEINPLRDIGEESCPFPLGFQSDRTLRSSTMLAPIISVNIGKHDPREKLSMWKL